MPKVDVWLSNSVLDAAERAAELEHTGVDGVFSFENAHDVFFPLVAAAPAVLAGPDDQRRHRLSPQPLAPGACRLRPPCPFRRPLPPRAGLPDPYPCGTPLRRDLGQAGRAHARGRGRHQGDPGRLAER